MLTWAAMVSYLEALGLGQQEVEASEPVGQYKQDVYEVNDAPQIRPHGATLYDVVILDRSIDLRDNIGEKTNLERANRTQPRNFSASESNSVTYFEKPRKS